MATDPHEAVGAARVLRRAFEVGQNAIAIPEEEDGERDGTDNVDDHRDGHKDGYDAPQSEFKHISTIGPSINRTHLSCRETARNGNAELDEEEDGEDDGKGDPHAVKEGDARDEVALLRLAQQLEPVLAIDHQ